MHQPSKSIGNPSIVISQENKASQMPQRNRRRSTIDHVNHGDLWRKKGRTLKTNIMEEKMKQMENNRLWKRLSEINNRHGQESEFSTSNIKSRQAYRMQKNKEIQHQNDMFVERLVKRLNSHHAIFRKIQDEKSHKRKKSKNTESISLPSIFAE